MFSKIGRTGGQVTWNFESATEGTWALSGKWYGTTTGTSVFVTMMNVETGETIEKRGTMTVERTLAVGPGERLHEPISKVSVTSIGGDVVGEDRLVKRAVEDYVSKVAQEVLRQRRAPALAAAPKDPSGSDKLRALVDKTTFTGSGSAAMGVAVTKFAAGDMGRQFLGSIVDVKVGDAGCWVRRFSDPADVSVWYSIRELELATPDDLVGAARYFLSLQVRETAELRSEIAKAAR